MARHHLLRMAFGSLALLLVGHRLVWRRTARGRTVDPGRLHLCPRGRRHADRLRPADPQQPPPTTPRAPSYAINNSANIAAGSFTRIGYLSGTADQRRLVAIRVRLIRRRPLLHQSGQVGHTDQSHRQLERRHEHHVPLRHRSCLVGGGGQIANMNVYSDVAGIIQGTKLRPATPSSGEPTTRTAMLSVFRTRAAHQLRLRGDAQHWRQLRQHSITNYGASQQTLISSTTGAATASNVERGHRQRSHHQLTASTGPSPTTPPTTRSRI